DQKARAAVTLALHAMRKGGIWDHLAGGFHRYSTDESWLVPHFEKMLYDNALLSRLYLHAYQVTGHAFYREVVEETLDFVLREMTSPEGGFFSSLDADSQGEEGRFYVWTIQEIHEALGAETQAFAAAYGVTPGGNFQGRNILRLAAPWEQRAGLKPSRRKLLATRGRRNPPGRDDKVLTAWNGLMLAAFTEAAQALNRPDYLLAAQRNAQFLWRQLRREDGRLWRTWRDGEAKLNGYLSDYSHLADGLLALYQTTFEPRWYTWARELAEIVLAHYSAPDGGFFDTSDDHEPLITRPRNLQDSAIPSGNAVAADVLLKLAGLGLWPDAAQHAQRSLRLVQGLAARYPQGFGHWLQALSYAAAAPAEVAILGNLQAPGAQALLAAAREGYRPFQVVAAGEADTPVPLLQGRGMVGGRAAAYLCRGSVCQAPVTEPERLQAQLAQR
ncbi:MAG: thioredoxin domain-containing protein, partial [Chloroflexi bacterium]|nr:thioredoxin domain-containing protein [Chloroflexota bacterium]